MKRSIGATLAFVLEPEIATHSPPRKTRRKIPVRTVSLKRPTTGCQLPRIQQRPIQDRSCRRGNLQGVKLVKRKVVIKLHSDPQWVPTDQGWDNCGDEHQPHLCRVEPPYLLCVQGHGDVCSQESSSVLGFPLVSGIYQVN